MARPREHKWSNRMRTKFVALLALLAAGCGGGTQTLPPASSHPAPTPVSAVTSVVPTCASPLAAGASEPCSVVVMGNGSFNNTVNWSVSGGTISASGVFTAPAVTAATSITVTAVSVQDTVAGTATVNVTPPAPPAPPSVASVSVTCVSPVNSGATSQCAASVLPSTVAQTVTWTDSARTISGTGLFTAPTVTTTTNVTVTATSTADTTKSGNFTVVVNAPPPTPTVPQDLGAGSNPVMCVDSNGVIDVAWQTSTGISFARSTDNGSSFSAPVAAITYPTTPFAPINDVRRRHADATRETEYFFYMQLDSSNDIVILAKYSIEGVDDETAVAFSTDGQAFTANLAIPDEHTIEPTLAVDPAGAINVLWMLNGSSSGDPIGTAQLNAIRSTDGGQTFSAPQTPWTAPGDAEIFIANIGPQRQIYLTWENEASEPQMFFMASLDGGQTFSNVVELDSGSSSSLGDVLTFIDKSGNVNIMWSASPLTYYVRSTDQGQTFSSPSFIANPIDDFTVEANGTIDGVYANNSALSTADLFFVRSTDHGATFSLPVAFGLSPVPPPTISTGATPLIAVDASGKISVVFSDDANGKFSGDNDIYLSESTDGMNFSTPVDLSNTSDQTEGISQAILSSSSVRYILWQDIGSSQSQSQRQDIFFDAVP